MLTLRIWTTGEKRWYWHLYARNGQIVSGPAEGFVSLTNAIRSVWRVLVMGLQAIAVVRFCGKMIGLAYFAGAAEAGFSDFKMAIVEAMQDSEESGPIPKKAANIPTRKR